jgi:hypothetical protein
VIGDPTSTHLPFSYVAQVGDWSHSGSYRNGSHFFLNRFSVPFSRRTMLLR